MAPHSETPSRGPARPAHTLTGALTALLAKIRQGHATHVEITNRLQLRNRPWEEDYLHWAWDGHQWQLHGHLDPPRDGHRHSTTTRGWCQAVPLAYQPQPPPPQLPSTPQAHGNNRPGSAV